MPEGARVIAQNYHIHDPYHLPGYVKWLHRAAVVGSADSYVGDNNHMVKFVISETDHIMGGPELKDMEVIYLVYEKKGVRDAVHETS